jgi:hypothetical protein
MAEDVKVRKRQRATGGIAITTPRKVAPIRDEVLTEAVSQFTEAVPAHTVDDLIERYTGTRVTIDFAYTDHAPPPHGNPAIDHAAAPGAFASIAVDGYTSSYRIDAENAYRKEHQLRLMHRLLLRQANMAQVASALDLTPQEAYTLRKELFGRLSKEAGSIDMGLLAGKTMAFYDEIRGTALRNADGLTVNQQHVDRARYLALAMVAERHKHDFLTRAGFYDSVRLNPKVDDETVDDDMGILRQAMAAIMDPELHKEEIDYMAQTGQLTSSRLSIEDLTQVL